jgi:peptide/nickel transport system substrate-binding protein
VVAWVGNFGPNQTALELIQQQLKYVGIEIELVTGTVPDILAGQKDSKYDLTWGNLSRADGDVLRVQYSTKATNHAKIDDPALEDALQAQQATADPAKRAAFQATAQKILIDKNYVIPVHELTTVLGTAPTVHGVVLGADSRLSQLTDAFVTRQ